MSKSWKSAEKQGGSFVFGKWITFLFRWLRIGKTFFEMGKTFACFSRVGNGEKVPCGKARNVKSFVEMGKNTIKSLFCRSFMRKRLWKTSAKRERYGFWKDVQLKTLSFFNIGKEKQRQAFFGFPLRFPHLVEKYRCEKGNKKRNPCFFAQIGKVIVRRSRCRYL